MKTKVDLHCPADFASELADLLDEFANRVRKGEITVLSLHYPRDTVMRWVGDISTCVLEIEYLNRGTNNAKSSEN